jgi:uncharacterized membrane protein (UPF0127 family)
MTYHPSQKPLSSIRVLFPRTQTWVQAHLAETEADRVQGLHGRASLAPNEGMLFRFPDQRPPLAMTMAKMLIPLDILFIGQDMTVKHIAYRLQSGRQHPVLGPAVPWVLEVPANFARKHRLRCGDRAELEVDGSLVTGWKW